MIKKFSISVLILLLVICMPIIFVGCGSTSSNESTIVTNAEENITNNEENKTEVNENNNPEIITPNPSENPDVNPSETPDIEEAEPKEDDPNENTDPKDENPDIKDEDKTEENTESETPKVEETPKDDNDPIIEILRDFKFIVLEQFNNVIYDFENNTIKVNFIEDGDNIVSFQTLIYFDKNLEDNQNMYYHLTNSQNVENYNVSINNVYIEFNKVGVFELSLIDYSATLTKLITIIVE